MVLTATHAGVTTCGHPPSPPSNGYLMPYTSTVEGTIVTYVIQNSHHIGDEYVCIIFNRTAICNMEGNWELNYGNNFCAGMPPLLTCTSWGHKMYNVPLQETQLKD